MSLPSSQAASELTRKPTSGWSRLFWAVLGGLGTIVVGVVTAWGASFVDGSRGTAQPSQAASAPPSQEAPDCPTVEKFPVVEGRDTLGVLLKRSAAGCWVNVLDSVRPGDLFIMYVSYQNNTAEQQDDVSVRVLLPDGFEYSPGTTSIMNSVTGGVFEPESDGITTVGYDAGSYQPRGNVAFQLQVRMTAALAPLCGVQSWAPTAKVTTSASPDGLLAYGAIVTVRPECTG